MGMAYTGDPQASAPQPPSWGEPLQDPSGPRGAVGGAGWGTHNVAAVGAGEVLPPWVLPPRVLVPWAHMVPCSPGAGPRSGACLATCPHDGTCVLLRAPCACA